MRPPVKMRFEAPAALAERFDRLVIAASKRQGGQVVRESVLVTALELGLERIEAVFAEEARVQARERGAAG